jgi:hypothetical protein
MKKDLHFYEVWLQTLQHEQLDLIGLILEIELIIHENRKFMQLAKEEGVYENPYLATAILTDIRLKEKLSRQNEILDDIELDMTHVEFMIEQLKKDKNE